MDRSRLEQTGPLTTGRPRAAEEGGGKRSKTRPLAAVSLVTQVTRAVAPRSCGSLDFGYLSGARPV